MGYSILPFVTYFFILFCTPDGRLRGCAREPYVCAGGTRAARPLLSLARANSAPQLGFGTHRATAPRYGLLKNYSDKINTIKRPL